MGGSGANSQDIVGAGDRWIPDHEYALITGRVPIVCVDLLPLSGKRDPLVGLIRRKIPDDREGWCLIGGAVLRDEPLVEAVLRHVRSTLGDQFAIDQSTLRRLDVAEYFTRAGIGELVDPRKHAVSLNYVAECGGDPVPMGEGLEFRWFRQEELAAVPFGFGQGRVVSRLLKLAELVTNEGRAPASGG